MKRFIFIWLLVLAATAFTLSLIVLLALFASDADFAMTTLVGLVASGLMALIINLAWED